MAKINQNLFLFVILLGVILMFAKYTYAADVTVHIDEKEVVSALVSQGLTQLSQAKELIFRYVPQDLWSRVWTLSERLLTLTQNFLVAAISVIVQVVQPK